MYNFGLENTKNQLLIKKGFFTKLIKCLHSSKTLDTESSGNFEICQKKLGLYNPDTWMIG